MTVTTHRFIVGLALAATLCVAAGCKGSTSTVSSGGTVSTNHAATGPSSGSTSAPATRSELAAASSPTSGSAGKSHPCSLVTAADAHTALGVAAPATTTNKDDGLYTDCVYTSADGRHSLSIQILDDTDDKADFDKNVNNLTPVPGVGDGALFSSDMDLMSVLKGDVLINLLLSDESGDTTPAQVEAALTVVAKAAVSRL
jgi:hypothetical protein